MTMSSKMILLFGVPIFVGACAILWIYWDRLKKPPKKKIFISADCWLCVFDLLAPSQLGLGISMISHRFNFYVDEHFKTRRWALKSMEIKRKKSWNDTKEMEITSTYRGKPMSIPQKPLPKKVVGFRAISIEYIDNNVIAFLHCFRPLLAVCPINLNINTLNDQILEFILHNIWPMLGKNIHDLELSTTSFHRFRQFIPTILNECPLLRIVTFYDTADLFTEFPADDSAAASDGQSAAKWLFTPLQSNVPKVLRCRIYEDDGNFTSRIEAFKAAFANDSSPVNFIVTICFTWTFVDSDLPFGLTNELTREQLTLKRINDSRRFLLVRCPIARDESKWTKWEEEAIGWQFRDQWNLIYIAIFNEDNIGDGLLDSTPGPSDQQ